MKKFLFIIATAATIFMLEACKKEHAGLPVTTNPPPAFQPGLANAGPDQVFDLPVNFVTLDGSNSSSLETITGFSWVQISGNTEATIAHPARAITQVTDLVAGTYQFQLTVSNNRGYGKDTVKITISQPAEVATISDWYYLDQNPNAVYFDSLELYSSTKVFSPNGGSNNSPILYCGNIEYDSRNQYITYTKTVNAGVAEYLKIANPMAIKRTPAGQSESFTFFFEWSLTTYPAGDTDLSLYALNTYQQQGLSNTAFGQAVDQLFHYQYRNFIIPNTLYYSLVVNWSNYLEAAAALGVSP